jgi:hypothetical protein
MRARARGHRDVATMVGHAASISAGEWIAASGEPCGATGKRTVCTHDSESVRDVSLFGSRTRRRSRGDRFAECIVRTWRVDAMAVSTAYKYKVRATHAIRKNGSLPLL